MKFISVEQAIEQLNLGHIIAYPTEAVYGLGCDPFNETAVHQLLQLKKRPSTQGFILLISDWEMFYKLTAPLPKDSQKRIEETWPGAVSWVCPAASNIPDWITGGRNTIALRMSTHPVAHALVSRLKYPIISTSANHSGKPPITDPRILHQQFHEHIAGIVEGPLGDLSSPTPLFDALTGERFR